MNVFAVIAIIVSVSIVMIVYGSITECFYYDPKKFESKGSHAILPFYPKTAECLARKQAIPYRIYQTNYTNQVSTTIYETCMIIRNMNPEYDYYFYDDQACRAYIKAHYPANYLTAYDMILPGAYKADLFRYLVLYREGGVYMDCKSSTIRPLRDFIEPTSTFTVFRDRPLGSLLNSFMACTPNHPILKIVVEMTVANILSRHYGKNALDITGPQVLGRAFNRYMKREELTDIHPGKYGTAHIVGSFYVLGEGTDAFDALVDESHQPLVAKTSQNYYANPNRMDYGRMWNEGRVYA